MRDYLRGTTLAVVLVLVIGVGTVQAGAVPIDGQATSIKSSDIAEQPLPPLEDVSGDEVGEEDEEASTNLIGDWWGLGGEANEAPFIGVAEGGVVLLVVGVLGYSVAKRKRLLPTQYRRYQLQAHQWVVLIGTALTLPHFVAVEEWEGFGLAVGVLLGIEVVSGLYGRYLHRHVIRLGRGDETPAVVDRLLTVTKETLFSRWRRVHVLLTVVTGLAIVLHVVIAVGD